MHVRFTAVALAVVCSCALLGYSVPELAIWARALGARSIAEVGLLPQYEPQFSTSFWMRIDSSFRLPVLIAYLALVIVTTIWPAKKNLAELIALSAALLVASQFWYLDKGGTLVMLYLPLAIAMMFRPTLTIRRPLAPLIPARRQPTFAQSIFAIRNSDSIHRGHQQANRPVRALRP